MTRFYIDRYDIIGLFGVPKRTRYHRNNESTYDYSINQCQKPPAPAQNPMKTQKKTRSRAFFSARCGSFAPCGQGTVLRGKSGANWPQTGLSSGFKAAESALFTYSPAR